MLIADIVVGNIFAVRPGRKDGPPTFAGKWNVFHEGAEMLVLMLMPWVGSHMDTQVRYLIYILTWVDEG